MTIRVPLPAWELNSPLDRKVEEMIEQPEEVFLNEGFAEHYGDSAYGLQSLIDEQVELWCLNFIYAGILREIRIDAVLLENPSVVYETGDFTQRQHQDAQSLNRQYWWVKRSAIESYGKRRGANNDS